METNGVVHNLQAPFEPLAQGVQVPLQEIRTTVLEASTNFLTGIGLS